MSILNKLKKLNANNAPPLFERHPLAVESLEMRLQYLAGVALATAIDREPAETERQAFSALANSLSVDATDAEEQLNERASVNEDDIAVLFDAIRQKNATWIYLLDLAWLHAANGTADKAEEEATEQLAELLKIDTSKMASLQAFAFSLKNRDFAGAIKNAQFLPNDSGLEIFLPQFLGFQRYEVIELIATHDSKTDKGFSGIGQMSSILKKTIVSSSDRETRILKWRAKVGDTVSAAEIIAEHEGTSLLFGFDRIEVVAPFSGVIQSITAKEDSSVAIGDVVGILYRTEFDNSSEKLRS